MLRSVPEQVVCVLLALLEDSPSALFPIRSFLSDLLLQVALGYFASNMINCEVGLD